MVFVKLSQKLITLLLVLLILGGCSSPQPTVIPPTAAPTPVPPTATPEPSPTPEPKPVTLQFIGNSCILMVAADGTQIISDPYGANHTIGIGSLPKNLTANAVTVSHAHEDHNNTAAISGSPQIIDEAGSYQVGTVKITGYAGFEGSPTGPEPKNPHVIFVFEVDGIKIVHLGDSGPVTDPATLAAIQNADVLLFSIDGYVIPAAQILPFLDQAKPRTMIAIHYNIYKGKSSNLTAFLKTLPADLPVVQPGSEIKVTPNMPKQVVVLTPLTQEK